MRSGRHLAEKVKKQGQELKELRLELEKVKLAASSPSSPEAFSHTPRSSQPPVVQPVLLEMTAALAPATPEKPVHAPATPVAPAPTVALRSTTSLQFSNNQTENC